VKAFSFSRKSLAIVLLVAVGVAKLPLEENLSNDLRAQHLQEPPIDIGTAESLGQMAAAASLGGLRSLAASIFYLVAYGAFEDTRWNDLDALMSVTTRLEPHNTVYWEEASWHMAYNAAGSFLRDTSLRPAIQRKLYREKVARGVDILQEGLRYLPNNPKLLLKLAMTYQDKVGEPPVPGQKNLPGEPSPTGDPRKAAETFLACYEHGGPDYAERFAGYQLTKLSDRASWEKAYEILKRYYDMGMKKKGTTIMECLPILEERLNIPQNQRAKAAENDELPRYKIKPTRPDAVGAGKGRK
jgi:hypothetical protein